MRGTEAVIRHRPSTETDRFGDPVGEAPDLLIAGCIVLPRGVGGEDNQGATTVISGLQVFCPPGTDVKATDELTVRGRRYEVDGEPGDYRNTRGSAKTLLVNVKRATG